MVAGGSRGTSAEPMPGPGVEMQLHVQQPTSQPDPAAQAAAESLRAEQMGASCQPMMAAVPHQQAYGQPQQHLYGQPQPVHQYAPNQMHMDYAPPSPDYGGAYIVQRTNLANHMDPKTKRDQIFAYLLTLLSCTTSKAIYLIWYFSLCVTPNTILSLVMCCVTPALCVFCACFDGILGMGGVGLLTNNAEMVAAYMGTCASTTVGWSILAIIALVLGIIFRSIAIAEGYAQAAQGTLLFLDFVFFAMLALVCVVCVVPLMFILRRIHQEYARLSSLELAGPQPTHGNPNPFPQYVANV